MKLSRKNRVRIVGGHWRSRNIGFPDVDGLRPTADRVRETLFNWLGQSLHGKHCLDAFAGSGALGFEAASRGAASVTMCELDRSALIFLRENALALEAANCTIIAGDSVKWLERSSTVFDIVFCDPPFADGLHEPFLSAISSHIMPESLVYVESGAPLDKLPVVAAGYDLVKSAKAGAVFFGLLRLKTTG